MDEPNTVQFPFGPEPTEILSKFMNANLDACKTKGEYASHAFRQFGSCLCGQQVLVLVHGTYTSVHYWQGKVEAWVIRALPTDTPSREGGESETLERS